uniref:HIRAN domain-containing protein n=1 Tax=Branchiostoma floridae TaxID=7739 RepID=C3YE02_BRAFL|eukprot:XP_002605467.1 hypothetical protein BRAFLDRAFT_74281 [Branchiostoma floridae]
MSGEQTAKYRKRKADDDGSEDKSGGKKAFPDSPPHMPDRGSNDALDVITIDGIVIKGYHVFKRRPLQGLEMKVMREYDNPYDRNAFVVKMPDLSSIPADQHHVVTDEKRGTTVRSIAGEIIGRLPAGLCRILADMEGTYRRAMCVATGPPRASFAPWPKPSNRGGGAVVPGKVYLEVNRREKASIVAQLRGAVELHMSTVQQVIGIN